MIIPSFGWFIEKDSDIDIVNEAVEGYRHYCHLSFYGVPNAEKYLAFAPSMDYINSIHLPNDLGVRDYKKGGLVYEIHKALKVNLFNVHPWADELDLIVEEVVNNQEYTLCLENFRAKSGVANPITLVARFGNQMRGERLGVCLDFSHLDTEFGTYKFVKSMLPYIKIIHLSNRIDKAEHQPIHTHNFDINAKGLIGQVLNLPDLPVQEIVLEYKKVYERDLMKHTFWLKDLIQTKRRKFSDE